MNCQGIVGEFHIVISLVLSYTFYSDFFMLVHCSTATIVHSDGPYLRPLTTLMSYLIVSTGNLVNSYIFINYLLLKASFCLPLVLTSITVLWLDNGNFLCLTTVSSFLKAVVISQ